ncbi:hypothetical protein ACINNAV57_0952 [Acinetobacter baumannii Naval-57]|nr:hypothetical protein ACINNAV57_0952 [Acinetobacter baumannii Naval-57]
MKSRTIILTFQVRHRPDDLEIGQPFKTEIDLVRHRPDDLEN